MIRNMYPYKALVAILCISALLLAPLVARAEWSSGELAARAETAEHPGEAALARHRAALLDPASADSTVHPVAISPLQPRYLALTFTGGVALGLGGIAWLAISGRRRSALALGVLGLSAATAAAVPLAQLARARDLAIAMEDVAVHLSPAPSAPETGTLSAGDAVRIGAEHADFVEVSTAHVSGWVPRTALTRVVPLGA